MDSILVDFPILSVVLGVRDEDVFCDCQNRYKVFELKVRGSKKVRTIEAPCPHLKRVQRALLDRILGHIEVHEAAMAFSRGKSITMNARRHHGARYLFTTDIQSFFPSITAAHVKIMLEKRFCHLSIKAIDEIISMTTRNSRLPQGAPTSPIIANLVMYDFDERCRWFSDKLGAVYTRYADDISISANDADILRHFESVVCEGLRTLGMDMHAKKTRHYGPDQRKMVTGLDIGGERIRPPRTFRKKATALVRMTMKYPDKMQRHRARICGHLAFWYDVDPVDPDLAKLLKAMDLQNWARRCALVPKYDERSRSMYDLDDDIPF